MNHHPRFLWVPPLLLVAIACGGGGGSAPAPIPSPPVSADFSLTATPAAVQIPAGGSAYVTVTLTRLNGFSSDVTLSGTGLPAGVVASGTIPSGSSSLVMPIVVDPAVTASAYSGINLQGQAGTLTRVTPFGLTVAAPLPPSHLRVDLVQASGVRQSSGTVINVAVAREPVSAITAKDASDSTRVRHGFDPSGTPTDH